MSSQIIIPNKSLTSNTDSGYTVTASSTGFSTYRGFAPFTTASTTGSWISDRNKYSSDVPNRFNYALSAWNTSSTTNMNSKDIWPNADFADINGSPNENSIQMLPDPFGVTNEVWVCKNQEITSGDPDGGWNVRFSNVSDTKSYVSIVFVKRVGATTSGSFYHGCSGSGTVSLDGNTQVNPYFTNSGGGVGLWQLPQDEWCVSIGFIYGKNSTETADNPNGGIYVITGPNAGQKLNTGPQKSFKMKDGATSQVHRAYLFYSNIIDTYSSTNTSTLIQSASSLLFYEPKFNEWNPSQEFNLQLLTLPTGAVFNNKYIGTSKINDRLGEYLTIELPKKIRLFNVNIQNRNHDLYRGDPFTVYVYGKNDEETWTEIGYKTNLQPGRLVTNTINISSTNDTMYKKYALLFTNVIKFGDSYVSVNKINFRGVPEDAQAQVTVPDRNLVDFLSPINYSLQNVNYVSDVVGGNLPGTYTITESSRFPDFNYEPYYAFDNRDNTLWLSRGVYNNSSSTMPQINGIQGEYIILECPIRYKLNGYRLKNSSWSTNIPDTVYLFGSNDKSTWTQLDFQQNLVSTVQEMNPPQTSTRSWFTINPQESYKSYAILASKINTNLVKAVSINSIEFLATPDTNTYVSNSSYVDLTDYDDEEEEEEDNQPESSSISTTMQRPPSKRSDGSTTSTSSTSPSPSSKKLSGGAIAGIVIAGFVFIVMIWLFFFRVKED